MLIHKGTKQRRFHWACSMCLRALLIHKGTKLRVTRSSKRIRLRALLIHKGTKPQKEGLDGVVV